jgi:hypothetical protein
VPNPAEEVVRNWRLFDVNTYRAHSPDLQAMSDAELFRHFVAYGMWEGRAFVTPAQVARTFASINANQSAPNATPSFAAVNLVVTVLASSKGNSFMRGIADELVQQLEAAKVLAKLCDETVAPLSLDGHLPVVVAPHEFFILGDGVKWQTPDFIRRAVMLSTEQPQTAWFRSSVPYLLHSKGVIELCYQTAETLRRAGKNAYFHIPAFRDLTLIPQIQDSEIPRTPIVQALPEAALQYDMNQDAFSSRPIDVAFFGTDSSLRDDFFAAATPHLARLRQVILYRRLQGSPKLYGTDREIEGINNFVLQRTRILINVHRDPLGYFEIHRMGVMGFMNKALVVSNHCFPHPIFKPGEHYLEETICRIPKLIDWLITTQEGQDLAEKVRMQAYETYRRHLSIEQQSIKLADFLASLR